MQMHEPCLVIPCYNEAARLPREEILASLAANPHLTVCLVNDGSTDGTSDVLNALRMERDRILVLHCAENHGKAEAVRQGVLHVCASPRFAFIGYWDADMS